MKKIMSTFFIFLMVQFVAFGQDKIAEIKELALEHLKIFQKNLEDLTSDELSNADKEKLISTTKKLFTQGATIQTMDLNSYRNNYDVITYLRKVTFPIDPRVDINISFLRDPKIDSVTPIESPKNEFNTYTDYLVTGELAQYYEKLVDGVKKYADFTIKEAYVRVSNEYGPNGPYLQVKIFKIHADRVSKR